MSKRSDVREGLLRAWLADYVQLAVAQQQGNGEAAEEMQTRLEELAAVGQPLDRALEVHRKRLLESVDGQLAELTDAKVRRAITEQTTTTKRRISQERRRLRALRVELGGGRQSTNGTARRKPAKRTARKRTARK